MLVSAGINAFLESSEGWLHCRLIHHIVSIAEAGVPIVNCVTQSEIIRALAAAIVRTHQYHITCNKLCVATQLVADVGPHSQPVIASHNIPIGLSKV